MGLLQCCVFESSYSEFIKAVIPGNLLYLRKMFDVSFGASREVKNASAKE
jgi:hypothetical protein